MSLPSLSDALVTAAQKAGCRDQSKLRHLLDDASDKRQPMVEAVLDANLVDEESFFAELAGILKMPYAR